MPCWRPSIKTCEHQRVVTVYQAGESEHGLYLAMRLVPGSNLATPVHGRTLDATSTLRLLGHVGDASTQRMMGAWCTGT
jgi:hypothetical protein